MRRERGFEWVRDTYFTRNTRSSRWKSGKVAEVSGGEVLDGGERFLKLGCGFQDIWKTRECGRDWGLICPRLQQELEKGLWMRS